MGESMSKKKKPQPTVRPRKRKRQIDVLRSLVRGVARQVHRLAIGQRQLGELRELDRERASKLVLDAPHPALPAPGWTAETFVAKPFTSADGDGYLIKHPDFGLLMLSGARRFAVGMPVSRRINFAFGSGSLYMLETQENLNALFGAERAPKPRVIDDVTANATATAVKQSKRGRPAGKTKLVVIDCPSCKSNKIMRVSDTHMSCTACGVKFERPILKGESHEATEAETGAKTPAPTEPSAAPDASADPAVK